MTELKLLSKPEGFELRNKRSDKASDGELWSPQDALYDASRSVADKNVDSILIVYRELHGDNTQTTHYRSSGNEGSAHRLLMAALGKIMGWAK